MRDIMNVNEWTDDELKNVRNKIVLELENRVNRREYELRDKIRTALLDYADFLDTNHRDKYIEEVENDNTSIPIYIYDIIEWFSN